MKQKSLSVWSGWQLPMIKTAKRSGLVQGKKVKQCARQKEYKDESEPNWRWQDRGVYQSICRDCQHKQSRDHYEKNSDNIKTKSSETRKRAQEEAQRFIYEYLSYSHARTAENMTLPS